MPVWLSFFSIGAAPCSKDGWCSCGLVSRSHQVRLSAHFFLSKKIRMCRYIHSFNMTLTFRRCEWAGQNLLDFENLSEKIRFISSGSCAWNHLYKEAYRSTLRVSGLGVWFLLRVQQVESSIRSWPHYFSTCDWFLDRTDWLNKPQKAS